MFKLNRKTFYILLFGILWLITAFSSFFHAVEFFELSNVTWMGIILAMAFEIGQASVLMSILTSSQDRKKYTPWILMCILTLVQIIGNVYSSYKYIMLNSPENLRYFKEPIFIWTQLPDAEATVIITYVSAAILPIVALLMTSMITNYLSDTEDDKKITFNDPNGAGGDSLLNQHSILQMENQGLEEDNKQKDDEIKELKKQLEDLKYSKIQQIPSIEIHKPEELKNDNEGEIREGGLEEDGQTNEEGIEGDEIEEDESDNIRPESLEKIIDEEQKPLEVINDQTENEISEDQHMHEEEPIIEKNDKETHTIENKQLKSSHFINL